MKIICIGRNYIKHSRELDNPIPEEPLFFLKPETAIQPKRHPFFIPHFSNNIHYEVELVLKINKAGKHIEEKFAHKYYSEIGLGIDFTARDIQEECKSKGLPWEKAKGFDGSAQISDNFIKTSNLLVEFIIRAELSKPSRSLYLFTPPKPEILCSFGIGLASKYRRYKLLSLSSRFERTLST